MKKFINPFRYMSLRTALCWGLAALILTSVFVWQVGLRLTSLTQINYLGERLWASTLRQVVVWLLFSVVLYIIGIIASRSKVRFMDVAAFNLFARLPFDLSLLIFAIPTVRSVMALIAEGSLDTAMQYMGVLTTMSIVMMIFIVWYYVWSYNAFSEATNLKGGKGVGLFIVGYVVTYIASGYVMMLF